MTTRFARALALGCLLLGCAPAFAAPKTYVYVHDRSDPNQVYAFQLTGAQLSAVPGSPFVTSAGSVEFGDGNTHTLAYSAVRHELFVTGSLGVAALKVNADGTLAEVQGSPFAENVAVDQRGCLGVAVVEKAGSTYVYAATEASVSRVLGFKVNDQGSLVQLPASPFPTDASPGGLCANGDSLFVPCQASSVIDSFKVNDDGSLTPAGVPSAFVSDVFTAYTDPAGKYVYTPGVSGNSIRGFQVNSTDATLTPLNPFSFPTTNVGNAGAGLAFSKTLVFGFSYGVLPPDIKVFSRAKKGILKPIASRSSGLSGLRSGAVVKNVLIAASSDSDAVRTYKIQGKGILKVADTKPTPLTLVTDLIAVRR